MGGDASEFNSKQHCKFVTPPGFVSLGSPLKKPLPIFNMWQDLMWLVEPFLLDAAGDPNPRHIILD
jgi:hypothetical protein